jgi:hypothetical protein
VGEAEAAAASPAVSALQPPHAAAAALLSAPAARTRAAKGAALVFFHDQPDGLPDEQASPTARQHASMLFVFFITIISNRAAAVCFVSPPL